MQWTLAVKIAVIMSGFFLWLGMLTGVWKYYQIRQSKNASASHYVDIAHRSSLLYAPASLILAVMAYLSLWSARVNLICVLLNLVFFSLSIAAYILHGVLKDTHNQFKVPHQLGTRQIPTGLMHAAMQLLIVAEVGATGLLLCGMILGLLSR